MATQALSKVTERMPSIFDDFFSPWNQWFEQPGLMQKVSKLPAVNITEEKDAYKVSIAVPGFKKEDFKIDVDGNMLTISSEKEESKEEADKKFTRKEYNYTSFTRSFTMPEEVNLDKINAKYVDGILSITLPRKEQPAKVSSKQITVG